MPDERQPYRPIQHPARTLALWVAWMLDVGFWVFARALAGQCETAGCQNGPDEFYDTAGWVLAVLAGLSLLVAAEMSHLGRGGHARGALVVFVFCATTAVIFLG